ncbi:MAG: UxaA family hydrolase [Firmicutes bacterium]|nr:UxaA family hydrolase [Bacillota bacterium]
MEFMGYVRADGQVGARNYVAVIPSVVCATEVVEAIVSQTELTKGYFHHQGCCQLPPDLERVTDSLIGLGANPNVGAALVVSLGCEGVDNEKLVAEIAKTGKPVEIIRIQELGGTTKAIARGIEVAQKLVMAIAGQQREPVAISNFVMGIKCGASDATSGMASNCAIGYVADKIVDLGGTVVFGETTEFIGAEHILARRAVTPEVGEAILKIVEQMERRAKSLGCDMRKGQPTPGNIAGGLSSIEEKSLGAIVKSGTRPIQGVMDYADRVNGRKGLWIKDTPGREPEILTGMAIAGAQCILFSTGRGAPQGFPTVPVLKICGNPNTFAHLQYNMDINAGRILTGEKSIEEVGEEIFAKLLRVLSGETTKGESIRYSKTMDIYTMGPVI